MTGRRFLEGWSASSIAAVSEAGTGGADAAISDGNAASHRPKPPATTMTAPMSPHMATMRFLTLVLRVPG